MAYTPTPTPTPGHGLFGSEPTLLVYVLFILLIIWGSLQAVVVPAPVMLATRYVTGLSGVRRVARLVHEQDRVRRFAGRLPRGDVWVEGTIYSALAVLFAGGALLVSVLGAQALVDTAVGYRTFAAVYSAGFVGFVWTATVGVLTVRGSESPPSTVLMASLAAELAVFVVVLSGVAHLVGEYLPLLVPLGAARPDVGVVVALAAVSAAARRVESLPEPGDRTYAASLVGLGVPVAGVGLLAVVAGLAGPGTWLARAGGTTAALGALAALATVD
jgi:hypothetical protein